MVILVLVVGGTVAFTTVLPERVILQWNSGTVEGHVSPRQDDQKGKVRLSQANLLRKRVLLTDYTITERVSLDHPDPGCWQHLLELSEMTFTHFDDVRLPADPDLCYCGYATPRPVVHTVVSTRTTHGTTIHGAGLPARARLTADVLRFMAAAQQRLCSGAGERDLSQRGNHPRRAMCARRWSVRLLTESVS